MQVKLQISVGRWEAVVTPAAGPGNGSASAASPGYRVIGTAPLLTAERKARLLAELGECPLELYKLLQGQGTPLLDACDLSTAQAEACSCGAADCPHAAAAAQALAAAPLQRLQLAGLPREELLRGVFAAWPQEMEEASSAAAMAGAGTRGSSRSGGAAIGEWIAEAAAEGTLHRPGPGFHAVEVKLPQELVADSAAPDAAGLLPGLPRAAQAFELIRGKAAARAREAYPPKNSG
ncbi:phosphoribosylglycinamide synthetase [Paenibacillus sp. P96]|uniref:Phosphoribosylglycinamide synthetase n=1 Tax=Paenibacillus zeirhizosphaerae TaxID=2987519 RepID=A0ABT9FUZ2_9BACL|nr:phosphoribosylglycinamide synthetase [Paenibacillus sp. P96]MDP4098549.1 phosphoribosylglycinamide synthetase [Paenibacillus sp. P96]